MALTTVVGENVINVTFDGATAFDITTDTDISRLCPNGIAIKAIQFIPAAADDTLTIRLGSATGVILTKFLAADKYDAKVYNPDPDRLHKIYIVGNQATSGVLMILEV